MTPPDRFKPREDWTVDEVAEHRRTGAQPETDEYLAYVRRMFERNGLEPPDVPLERKPIEDMTPEDHFQRIQRNR